MLQVVVSRGGKRIVLDEYDITKAASSSRYNEEGAGFLELDLEIKISYNVADTYILIGDDITCYKYGGVVYKGHVVSVKFEKSSDIMSVSCMGELSVFEEEEFFWIVSDNRTSQWKTRSDRPADNFRPDLYSVTQSENSISMNPNTNDSIPQWAYVDVEYTFPFGETAQRFNPEFIGLCSGNGILFESTINTVDSGAGTLTHQTGADVSLLESGDTMTLWNATQDENVLITTVGTPTNGFTINGDISDWVSGDSIYVYGPKFKGLILSKSGAVITYDPLWGEGNLGGSTLLYNITQRQIAFINSVDAGANTITVGSEDDITEWGEAINGSDGDEIVVVASLYTAQINGSVTGVSIPIDNEKGRTLVDSTTGWILHNSTRNEVAEVDSWVVPDNIDVTDSADISAWANDEVINIYSPFRVGVYDEDDNLLWPADWRMGAVPQQDTTVDWQNASSTSTQVKIYYQCLIAGQANEYSFCQIKEPSIRSTTINPNIQRYLEEFVPATTFGIRQDTNYLNTGNLVAINEPCFVEQGTPKTFLTEMANLGNYVDGRIVWGVTKDGLVFVKSMTDGPTLIVDPEDAEFSIEDTDSVQIARTSYSDKYGNRVLSAWTDTEKRHNNRYRRRTIDVQTTSATDAAEFLDTYLELYSETKYSIKVDVGSGKLYYENMTPVIPSQLMAENQVVKFSDALPKSVDSTGKDGGNFNFIGNIEEIEVDLITEEIEISLTRDTNEARQILAKMMRSTTV